MVHNRKLVTTNTRMTTMLAIVENIPVVAQILIGFYFTFFGVWNLYHWQPIFLTMNENNVPHPWLLLPLGIVWQIAAGVMIMSNIYIKVAALSLIPFILMGAFVFHPFWKYKGYLRALNFIIFAANFTVILAALLLLISLN